MTYLMFRAFEWGFCEIKRNIKQYLNFPTYNQVTDVVFFCCRCTAKWLIVFTDLERPSSTGFVIVTDALKLTSSSQLPDDKLQAPPQTLTVQERQ